VSAVYQEDVEQLELLKAANEITTKSLQNDLATLQGKYKLLLAERDEQRDQLVKTYQAKDKLSEEVARLKQHFETDDEDKPATDQNGLDEVSPANAFLREPEHPRSPVKKWFGRLSRLSILHPIHRPKRSNIEKENPIQSEALKAEMAELERELAAIGNGPSISTPPFSPTTAPTSIAALSSSISVPLFSYVLPQPPASAYTR
jgi:hypothetical protein